MARGEVRGLTNGTRLAHIEAQHISSAAENGMTGEYLAYVGTYTSGESRGIYCLSFDVSTGALEPLGVTGGISSPSFLEIAPSGEALYAISADFRAMSPGAARAYAIDRRSGALTLINERSSEGAGPCHVSVDSEGRAVYVANYGGGSVAALPIMSDGSLGKSTGFVQHEGSSVDPDRQMEPHAHSINLDASNSYAFVADLGLDKLLVYKIDRDTGTLTPNSCPHVRTPPGAGPRHFAFHPNGKFAYLINEMGSSVTVLRHFGCGRLNEVETVSTLPQGFTGVSHCADVHVAPSGKFLYGSNRGHDSIAIFAIDEQSGRLDAMGHEQTGGQTPRNFAIDPTGSYLLAANQDSNNIVVFKIDGETGGMSATDVEVEIPSPVCVKLTPRLVD